MSDKRITKSLKRKVLLPIAIIGFILAGVTAFVAHFKFQELLIEKLAVKAELVANTVNYAAEGLSRAGELQRIVTSLGAEPEINMILVVAGTEPAKIIATTKNVFLGESLSYLTELNISEQIQESLQTSLKQQRFDGKNGNYSLALPVIMSNQKTLDEKFLINAVVFVQLDSKSTQNQVLYTIGQFALSIWTGLAILGGYFYHLLRHHILTPVTRITREVNTDKKNQPFIFHKVDEYDEISVLDETLHEALWSANETQNILEIQKIELQKSRDQFEALVTNIPGITFRCALDSDWTMLFISGLVEELTGYPTSDFTQNAVRTYASVIHPDDCHYVDNVINAAVKGNRPYTIEYRVVHRSGKIVWVHERGRGVTDESGEICFIDGFILDISEKKQMELSLAASEFRWKFAVEGSGDGIWDWNVKTSEVWFSTKWKSMLGFTENEIESNLGEWEKRVHPDDKASVMFDIKNYLDGKTKNYANEHRVLCKDGTYKWMLDRGVIVSRDAEGKPSRLIGTHTDITERKLFDVERNRLLQVIEDSPDFIGMADMQANLKYLNLAAKRMVGLPEDVDISRLKIDDMHPQWGAKLVKEEGLHAILLHGFWKNENAVLHRDGSEIPVSQILTLHRDENGNPHLLSTIMRDISKEKEVEQILVKNKATAESLAKSKSEFLANMSHEIRTPMNAIMGLSQLALNKEMPNDVRDSLEKINSSSESLLGILNDILDFSKIDAGKLALENVPFNLTVMLRNLHNLFSSAAQKKHLEFKLLANENIPSNLIGDSLRIQQILSNLLGNAIKFTDKGHVELKVTLIELKQNLVKVRFCIGDTGIGIKKEHQEHLFNAFHQADMSITRRFGGTGLGLAISLSLLRLMDSHFEMHSQENEGTTICFDLWLHRVEEEKSKIEELKQANSTHQQGNLSEKLNELGKDLAGLHVLLAEDNLLNQEIICGFLKLLDMNVDTAFSGLDVLSLLENKTYDVILMDVNMPEMSGIEATEIIRTQPKYEKLPIIALTAGVTTEEKTKCFACGMNSFVAKPVNPEELISVIKSVTA